MMTSTEGDGFGFGLWGGFGFGSVKMNATTSQNPAKSSSGFMVGSYLQNKQNNNALMASVSTIKTMATTTIF